MRQIKEREEPTELKYLRFLKPRRELTIKENQYYLKLLKGFEGEKEFDRLLQQELKVDCLVINGLLLEHNLTVFQIDSLLIFQNDIFLIEIKYFEGDFYTDDGRWHVISGKEIKNPLLQIQRSESTFRQLQQSLKVDYAVNASLVFNHPKFHLYNAALDLPVIFPAQLYRFMNRLNDVPSEISQKQETYAAHLVSRHITDSSHTRVPDYDYDQLKKGIICSECLSFLSQKENKWVCNKCGKKESFEHAVLRAVIEFRFLFPNRKVTTKTICEWCGIYDGQKNARRILNKHFKRIGNTNNSYFV
ncbi:NERD domain-containing protein [Salicibibacter cibarius]|uniref:NERD domain-containing protein n=1 Tax=Salicibibacter cibarius TaxID=2743000 RepID=A0A7T6Z4T4_9BACI|nr:nuclease-related domain-containing protein [Salicibibacter cibarius]QQK77010.1 NERD domain-containing protein [Salicibibacter cibarius]